MSGSGSANLRRLSSSIASRTRSPVLKYVRPNASPMMAGRIRRTCPVSASSKSQPVPSENAVDVVPELPPTKWLVECQVVVPCKLVVPTDDGLSDVAPDKLYEVQSEQGPRGIGL